MACQIIIRFRDNVERPQAERAATFLREMYAPDDLATVNVVEGVEMLVVGDRSVELTVDGIAYGVEVGSSDGKDNVKFTSDPPPRGLHRIRYEWTGDLKATR